MKVKVLPGMLMVVLALGSVSKSHAQTQSNGLYLTYTDYINHKQSYTEDANTTIYIHEFFGGGTVTVTKDGKDIVLEKDNLFGYHDSSGKDFRFKENKAYQIIDTAGFFIYSYDELLQHGKGAKPTAVFYFSKKANGPIVPLTFYNVGKAFPENTKLRYLLDMASAAHEKPDAFDGDENRYKIKELYLKSLQ
jgi:hypothetical protein